MPSILDPPNQIKSFLLVYGAVKTTTNDYDPPNAARNKSHSILIFLVTRRLTKSFNRPTLNSSIRFKHGLISANAIAARIILKLAKLGAVHPRQGDLV